MAIRSQTKAIPAHRRNAEVGTVDREKRTVDVTWSTGAKVMRRNLWGERSIEELSMDPAHVRMGRLQSGTAPFLRNHQEDVADVMGIVSAAKIERTAGGAYEGSATIRFVKAGVDPAADSLFEKIADGVVRNVSVGYRTYKAEKIEGPDKSVPTIRAVDWEPFEVSAVAMGADPDAGFRSADQTQFNPCEFITREQGEGAVTKEELEALAAKQKAEAEALTARKLQLDNQEVEQVKRAADLAERERASGIKSACAKAKCGEAFEKRMLESKKSLAEVREMIIDDIAERSDKTAPTPGAGSGVTVGEGAREKWMKGAEAGQIHKSGAAASLLMTAIASHKRKVDDLGHRGVAPGLSFVFDKIDMKEDGGEFRSMSLVDLARDFLDTHGIKTRGMNGDALLKRAMYYRDSGSEQTTSDFSVVLENIMYKMLLGNYQQADDTWRFWCGVDSVQDFRPANRYRTGSFGVLDQILENDEYKHKSIPDGFKQQISVLTYGNKIALTRQAIVNDDMGAVLSMAEKFGRAAGLSLEVAAYALLAANSNLGPTVTYNGGTHALMNDSFGNINDTGSALSVAGLEADRVTMASQKDPSNNEILMLRPDTLLIPIGLEGEAKVINRSTTDPTIIAGNPTGRPNISAGLFKNIVGTPRITGTRRYLFSREQGVDSFKMVFLNGSQVPMMEQRPGWDIDGIEWKLRHDFNVQGFDPKGVVTNAGV